MTVGATRGGTILLVEDEEDIATLVRTYLEREGFGVVWVTRGGDALLALEQHDFRLAILDLQLPDADGLDLCRAIRDSSSLPVVIVTARDEEIDRIVGLELGASRSALAAIWVPKVWRRCGSGPVERRPWHRRSACGVWKVADGAEIGVADDEVLVVLKGAALVVVLEFLGDAVGHRDGAEDGFELLDCQVADVDVGKLLPWFLGYVHGVESGMAALDAEAEYRREQAVVVVGRLA